MTWDEFKNYVDEKLSVLSKDGSIEISYMQISSTNFDWLFDGPVVVTEDENYDGNHKLMIYNGGLVPPEVHKAEAMTKLLMGLLRRLKMLEKRPYPVKARKRFLREMRIVKTDLSLLMEIRGYENNNQTLPEQGTDF